MADVLLNIGSGLALSAVGGAAALFVDRIRRRRKLGHLYSISGKSQRVQIVVPSLNVEEFIPQGSEQSAKVPPNIRVMPMAEGGAIAQLVMAFQSIGRTNLLLVPQESYQEGNGITISIGGPSLNSVSARILQTSVPKFRIRYPEHTAAYGSTTFSPHIDDTGLLREDYGFIAFTRTGEDRHSIVLCGVWATGTQIAVSALLTLEKHSEARRLLEQRTPFFAVTHAVVRGLNIGNTEVVEIRRIS